MAIATRFRERAVPTNLFPSVGSDATIVFAKTRARVKLVFGAIEQVRGKAVRAIGQSRANFAMTMMDISC
jgi:hypothetical protein